MNETEQPAAGPRTRRRIFAPLAEEEPLVSVIIPALNEEKNIRRCLDSIQASRYPQKKIEAIVVDNGSSDGTVGAARACSATVIELPGAHIATMRNRGAREARGAVFAFIDADCTADAEWITQGVASLRAAACITGSRVDIPAKATWVEEAWFRFCSRGRHEASHINTNNLFVTREVFEALGGFDETLITGEDAEFSARANALVRVIDDERIRVVHRRNPKTLWQFMRREAWHGLGAFGSFRVHWLDKPLLGTLAFIALTAAQIAGVFVWLVIGSPKLFLAASTTILLLLVATVLYRWKMLVGLRHAWRSLVLYYCFYLARSASLVILLRRKRYYHDIKE